MCHIKDPSVVLYVADYHFALWHLKMKLKVYWWPFVTALLWILLLWAVQPVNFTFQISYFCEGFCETWWGESIQYSTNLSPVIPWCPKHWSFIIDLFSFYMSKCFQISHHDMKPTCACASSSVCKLRSIQLIDSQRIFLSVTTSEPMFRPLKTRLMKKQTNGSI